MATLEKIRSKSVMLFVIIIVALLAFILGDFFNSGRTFFGPGTTMVEAGDAKVDYQKDYQQRYELASSRSAANADPEVLSQNVLQQLALEQMLKAEYNNLGIDVTDKEISRAFTGENLHPYAAQFVAQISQGLGLNVPSGATVLDAVNNPAKYNLTPEQGAMLRQDWANMEIAVEDAMKLDKFNSLVAGLFTANELDAKQLYNDIQTSYTVSYATKSLNTVADTDVEVNDADRKAAWEENKHKYQISEPTRVVDYIRVDIVPSLADRQAAQLAVESALAGLNGKAGLDAVNSNPAFSVSRNRIAETKQVALKNFLDTAKVNDAVQLSKLGDTYTLVKLLGKTNEIDSIQVSLAISLNGELIDSIANTIGNNNFATAFEGNQEVNYSDSIWTNLYQGQLVASLEKALKDAPIGKVVVLTDSIQGQPQHWMYRVCKRHAPVPVYEYAEITYEIDPSNQTINNLSSAITTFVSNNSNAADFVKNATEAGYAIQTVKITPSTPTLGNLGDSRRAIKWLMEAEPGKVMPVYQDNKQSYFLTATVKGVHEDNFLPWNAGVIADEVNVNATTEKKAQKLIAEFEGKADNLDAYANLMGTNVRTARYSFGGTNRTFGTKVQGIIAAATDSAVVMGPVKNSDNVIVFTVKKNESAAPEFEFAEYANQFNGKYFLGSQYVSMRMFGLLLGNDKYDNKSLNFTQDFAK